MHHLRVHTVILRTYGIILLLAMYIALDISHKISCRKSKIKTFRKIVKTRYALTQPSFQYYREEIRLSNVDALRCVDNIPLEKWTRSFNEGRRWGPMIRNLVESMNNVFKGIRNLPITALVKTTYFRLGSLFATRGKKWHSVLQSGQLFSEICMKEMKEETLKASTHVVSIFD
ncbi:hypothetical protein KIW84_044856 [Lathyrus oleraceus]|uniref:Uncharacterized protein n=1 Tax=Pisum sativum TaxID=3888 RepID=A0A9D4XHF6_PEA|nr:hypothetical protein KIW84_044856 [Pisum sativum]